MAKRLQYFRLVALVLLLCTGLFGLAGRLVYIQVFRHDELRTIARTNTEREFMREPKRGDILDVKGNLLATSVFVKTVCANPMVISNRQADLARALAPVLQMSEADLYRKMLPQYFTNSAGKLAPRLSVRLKDKVPVETWEKARGVMSNLTFGVNEKALPKTQRKFFSDIRQSAIFCESPDSQRLQREDRQHHGWRGRHRAHDELQARRRAGLAHHRDGQPQARNRLAARPGRGAA
jgi:cell division protein FtsI/penicillin-binding protein 2